MTVYARFLTDDSRVCVVGFRDKYVRAEFAQEEGVTDLEFLSPRRAKKLMAELAPGNKIPIIVKLTSAQIARIKKQRSNLP